MRSHRSVLAVALVMALAVAAREAAASSNGITGYSGKQGVTCNACHSGGPAPAVQLQGPPTLTVGATGMYAVVVTTAQPWAGVGIAATDGITLLAGLNTVSSSGELTQGAPVAVAAGTATFEFAFDAPTTAGTVTIWAAGNATNGTQGNNGDRATAVVATIAIIDVAVDAGVDAPTLDAPTVDAPALDAPVVDAPIVDAPVVDAPIVDAPTVDAPALDGPPPPDAGVDGPPPPDAGVDGPPPPDAGVDGPPPADAGIDGPPPADAGIDGPATDATLDDGGTGPDAGDPGDGTGGCGCNAAAPAGLAAPLFVVLVGLGRRRRRRSVTSR